MLKAKIYPAAKVAPAITPIAFLLFLIISIDVCYAQLDSLINKELT